MNCKNCNHILESDAQFCDNCGAQIIINRITFKKLFLEFFVNVFGVDSKFFLTLRKMLTNPDDVINDYLSGVRKRYVNPFAFLAIGAGLSLLVFNYYSDEFIKLNQSIQSEQILKLKKSAEIDLSSMKDLSKEEYQKLQIEKKSAQFQLKFNDGIMNFMLHYYNLLSFIFLLFYTLLSKWTYPSPHNFGEHIVINAFISGFLTYATIILFIFSIAIYPSIYLFSFLLYIVYYMYVFWKFYNLSFGKNILKLLRFILGLLIFTIFSMIFGAILSFALTFFN